MSMRQCYMIVQPDYDGYYVLGVFTSRCKAQEVLDEVDLTPTGRKRNIYSIEESPLNASSFETMQKNQ
jgi:hypothetical protein